jgi:hypothetical protein
LQRRKNDGEQQSCRKRLRCLRQGRHLLRCPQSHPQQRSQETPWRSPQKL